MGASARAPGEVIALPTGGGAISGIGETFSPDLQTGTGNFAVPISLPPGRNGLQPQLSLQYSTGNGNGPFGLGWALGVPGVTRKTTSGIPQYDDAGDTFLISGAEDLVPVPGTTAPAQRYRPRTEGLFSLIDHYSDGGSNYWEVQSKDGLVSYYGTQPTPPGRDPAAVTDPNVPGHIFAWRLTRTVDPFGNSIQYLYERDAVQFVAPHKWDQVYLSEIRYADYGDQDAPEYLVRVKFTYKPRPDPFSVYRSGFEIRTVQRCTQIDIVTYPGGTETPVRTYHLTYLDQRGLSAELLPPNGMSLLSHIQVEGHGGSNSECLPPLEFGHSRFEPRKRHFIPVTGPDLPPSSLGNPGYELADVLGNGLPGVLEMDDTVRYWSNRGGGRFDLPRPMREAPAGVRLADPGVQLLDANGDGRIDLLVTTPKISGYYPMTFDGIWDRRSFQRYQFAPSFDLKDSEVRMVDLNGDGVTDALRSDTRFDCFFNDPETGWGKTRRVERRPLEAFPDVNFSDPRVKWADFSGDGMQDIALVYQGSVAYWPNLGYGNWGARIHMANSPRFPFGYNPARILIGDVDGDGLADIVYVDDGRVTLWINQAGNAWSDPITITGTPPVTDADSVRLTDLLGVGTSGILWSANATTQPRPRMFFLDFTGGIKPYLQNHMDNHIGSVTKVAYASSTSFYLKDQQQLATQWMTPLPFPVQVVARVEAIDQISGGKLTTEYTYHHGYWDGVDREFRGFGRVDQRDTEVFTDYNAAGLHGKQPFTPVAPASFSAPTETRTWFHLGPLGDEFGGWYEADFSAEYWAGDANVLERPPALTAFLDSLPRRVERDAFRAMRGRILRTELYALDGTTQQNRPYTVTESLAGVREEQPPTPAEGNRLHIFFPFDLAKRTTQWERGDDPMSQFTFMGMGDYDAYGQLLAQCNVAVPRGRDFTATLSSPAPEPYLATLTATTYADVPSWYCVNRVVRSTAYEVTINDGSWTVFKLAEEALCDPTVNSVIGQTYTYYDGPAFTGLPFGQVGDYGAAVRTETLVLTEDILQQAYQNGAPNPSQPPYLMTSGAPVWTADYPLEFQQQVPPLAGYVYHPGGPQQEDAAGFFTTTAKCYDFQQSGSGPARGLILVQRDPLGNDTTIAYDSPYQLLPVSVTDAASLTTTAAYDYRVMKPQQVTDPNGNWNSFTFTSLGLLATTSFVSKAGEGDQQLPSVQMEYDFLAFQSQQQPISVRTIRRVYHDSQTQIPLPQRDDTIESVQFSDGFGRLVQTRAQAEDVLFGDPVFGAAVVPADQTVPSGDAVGTQLQRSSAPNVVVSGWQVYDNKGRVVEKYEPFFSTGWDYAPPTAAQTGQKTTIDYDPRGRVVRTINPDGSEQIVVYGVPGSGTQVDLTNPDVYVPTPWEAYTYDPNDNAGRTNPTISGSFSSHWNTPSSIVVDALGRTIRTVARNGPPAQPPAPPAQPPTTEEWYVTTSTYDIQGNLLTITDALGRLAFQYVYDLAKHALRTENIDAGVRRTVLDAAGKPVENRDSKGALVLHAYDELNRPIRLWASDETNQVMTLRERLVYGDGADSGLAPGAALTANLLGKLFQDYDEAGLVTIESCDFKGNVLEKTRQVISDTSILSVFNPPPANWHVQAFRVDWSAGAAPLLDDFVYRTSSTFDALNRVLALVYPQDVTNARKTLTPLYNRAGALEHIELDGTVYVDRIAYNAKGQRSLISYGNGVMTRYAYDSQTFRLVRLLSEPYSTPAPSTYHPTGPALQDFAYSYDLVGNLWGLSDCTLGSGIPNAPDALDRAFTYDPIYRLLNATGREFSTPPPPNLPWDGSPRGTDVTLTQPYTEAYTYDSVGNLIQLTHSGSPTRNLPTVSGSNRLAMLTMGTNNFAYAYDVNGNMIQENTERFFEWDHSNRMKAFGTQPGNAEPSVYAQYLYDAAGQRVKKLVRKQGGRTEATVYIDGLFEHQNIVQGSAIQENNTVHIMDNKNRIAMIRVGNPFQGDAAPAVKYQLGDHLGSSNVVVDENGSLVNREEYTPYGETSFGGFARKRYRFTGKQRDGESGLYYHGARYYAPWLGRWATCDEIEKSDGHNLYRYCLQNPVRHIDSTGRSSEDLNVQAKAHQVAAANIEAETAAAATKFETAMNQYNQAKGVYDRYLPATTEPPKGPGGIYSERQLVAQDQVGSAMKRMDEAKEAMRQANRELGALQTQAGRELQAGTELLKKIDAEVAKLPQEGGGGLRGSQIADVEHVRLGEVRGAVEQPTSRLSAISEGLPDFRANAGRVLNATKNYDRIPPPEPVPGGAGRLAAGRIARLAAVIGNAVLLTQLATARTETETNQVLFNAAVGTAAAMGAVAVAKRIGPAVVATAAEATILSVPGLGAFLAITFWSSDAY